MRSLSDSNRLAESRLTSACTCRASPARDTGVRRTAEHQEIKKGNQARWEGTMKNTVRALATVILLSGCASASSTYGPDGKEAFVINCSGLARNWGMCYEKAGNLRATKGYEVIGQGGDSGAVGSVNPSGGFAGSVISRTLLVKCKD